MMEISDALKTAKQQHLKTIFLAPNVLRVENFPVEKQQ